jgi:hypothetical protein
MHLCSSVNNTCHMRHVQVTFAKENDETCLMSIIMVDS